LPYFCFKKNLFKKKQEQTNKQKKQNKNNSNNQQYLQVFNNRLAPTCGGCVDQRQCAGR
jgi:hypothetical protein